ncbi:hypothetical protein EVAR_88765_1 [Eumeta japonica]|uniref:Uncharacterized protein n=1 Tax=Eumeta variegata TaxID=151549 RepID=A0A4C1XRD2_EUMVA|nr:hypothetical protein EVAR_88765_1 [Eumeta japonica]
MACNNNKKRSPPRHSTGSLGDTRLMQMFCRFRSLGRCCPVLLRVLCAPDAGAALDRIDLVLQSGPSRRLIFQTAYGIVIKSCAELDCLMEYDTFYTDTKD